MEINDIYFIANLEHLIEANFTNNPLDNIDWKAKLSRIDELLI